jgi:hypothetical protein
MPTKRAQVPDGAYKRAAAIEKLTGGVADVTPDPAPATPDSNTVLPQHGNTAKAAPAATAAADAVPAAAKAGEKTTFYLRPDQVDKLDELALAYKRKTGKRVNRNDLVRQLIDQAELDDLLGRDERA